MKHQKNRLIIFIAVFLSLLSLRVLSAERGFSDLMKSGDGERYHPNGTEPIYVGIFEKQEISY